MLRSADGLDLLIEFRNVQFPQGMDEPHRYTPALTIGLHRPYPCQISAQMQWHRLHQEENPQ